MQVLSGNSSRCTQLINTLSSLGRSLDVKHIQNYILAHSPALQFTKGEGFTCKGWKNVIEEGTSLLSAAEETPFYEWENPEEDQTFADLMFIIKRLEKTAKKLGESGPSKSKVWDPSLTEEMRKTTARHLDECRTHLIRMDELLKGDAGNVINLSDNSPAEAVSA
jgi:hypothetical protein